MTEPLETPTDTILADAIEGAYERGERAAILRVLRTCLQELGYGSAESGQARWVLEREATIAALRSVCDEHGDNDWDDQLHLADVVDKHLARHLEESDVKRTR